MDRPALEAWLASYGRAWETMDPDAAVSLFAEDASYQETPFQEPMRGQEAIRAYWAQVRDHQRDIAFGSELLDVDGDRGVVHWWASYTNTATGRPTRLDGMFILDFDPRSGLCRSLREWWHADPAPSF